MSFCGRALCDDAFVTKLNPGKSALSYSTYLGGSGEDDATGLSVDREGNAYIAGGASSADFPVTAGAVQTTLQSGKTVGDQDAFVTKISAAGALIYSTLLGGSNSDAATGIATDSDGNAYVTGETASSDFPTTPGVIQQQSPGGLGTQLIYSTYLGGSDVDFGAAITLDPGNIYIAGSTSSSDFPTVNPIQPFGGGRCFLVSAGKPCSDAFIAKISGIFPSPSSSGADLSLSMSANPESATVGNNLIYLVTATGVTFTDTLPQGVDLVSVTASQGSGTPGSGKVSCGLSNLAGQAAATVRLMVTPKGAGSLKNSASIAAKESDPNLKNNQAQLTTEVAARGAASADRSMTLSASPNPVTAGNNLTYTFTDANRDPPPQRG